MSDERRLEQKRVPVEDPGAVRLLVAAEARDGWELAVVWTDSDGQGWAIFRREAPG